MMGEKLLWPLLLSYYLLILIIIKQVTIFTLLTIQEYQHLINTTHLSTLKNYLNPHHSLNNYTSYSMSLSKICICIVSYCLKYKQQMKVWLLVLIIGLINCQLPNEPAPKFALLTVTYARNNSFQTILNYVKHYAQTECYQSIISQICIIWNNEQLPENVGLMDRQLYWRMPVYFYLTTNNSLNHRFRVPKEANAQLFYSLDDDILVDCNTLKLTYAHYTNSKEAGMKTIITNEGRNYGFYVDKRGQFYYQGHSYATYYSIAQTGASFFSKSYLNLYYLNLDEITMLRNEVDNLTSCQDIFFMAIAEHFYPQMTPEYYKPSKQYKNTNPKVGLSRKAGLVALRTSCLLYLSEVFGYNPLRHYSKNASLYKDNWRFPNHNIIMQSKVQGFINVSIIQPQQRILNYLTNQQRPITMSNRQNQHQQEEDLEVQMNQEMQQDSKGNLAQVQINELKMQKAIINKQKQVPKQQVSPKFSPNKQKQGMEEQNKNEVMDQLPNRFQIIVCLLVVVIMVLMVSVFKLYRMYNKLKRIKEHSSVTEQEITIADQQF